MKLTTAMKKCCKRYERKKKACKDCPVVAALGCSRDRKKVKQALKKNKIAA